jgi:CRP-like cAMP-binding protein
MEDVIKFICAIRPQTKSCLSHLRKIIQFKTVAKGEMLLKPGEVCRELYFIRKGLIQSFFLEKEKEVVDWFFWENETIVEVGSFYDQSPSKGYLRAMEECEVYYITYDDLQNLYDKFSDFNFVGRVLQERYYMIFFRLCRSLKAESAVERYWRVLENQPELLNRVPLKDLAKYLKMAQSTLSRIRSRRHRN